MFLLKPSPQPSLKTTVQALFDAADIQINGDRPWDIQVHNEQLYGEHPTFV
jgi:hypothetical protein